MSTMKATVRIGSFELSMLTPSSNQKTRIGGGMCPSCESIHVIARGRNLDAGEPAIFETFEICLQPSELAEVAAMLAELARTHRADEAARPTQPAPRGCS